MRVDHTSEIRDEPNLYFNCSHKKNCQTIIHGMLHCICIRAVLYFVPKSTAVHNKTGYTVLAEDEKPPVVFEYMVFPVLYRGYRCHQIVP